jgi:hypothetical protein
VRLIGFGCAVVLRHRVFPLSVLSWLISTGTEPAWRILFGE